MKITLKCVMDIYKLRDTMFGLLKSKQSEERDICTLVINLSQSYK